jgi:LacI family transcriptional regulator
MARSSSRGVTLADVAAVAGVSRATASLVLRGSPHVTEETRLRVLASMRNLGYVYNRGAASLRSRRSQAVGLILPDIGNPFFAELMLGAESRLNAAEHVALLGNSSESLAKQERLLVMANEFQSDGIILCPAEHTTLESIDQVKQWGPPVVFVARYLPGLEIDYVGADNRRGAQLAVEHLLLHGHERVAFIGGPQDSTTWRDRLAGYLSAVEQQGPPDESLIVPGASTREGGYQAITRLLTWQRPPTAALCFDDVVAFGVMLGLQANTLRPGLDFAVVGFDDVAEAALSVPSLTTISVSPRVLGEQAADLLIQRVTGEIAAPERVILVPELKIRDSCGTH